MLLRSHTVVVTFLFYYRKNVIKRIDLFFKIYMTATCVATDTHIQIMVSLYTLNSYRFQPDIL